VNVKTDINIPIVNFLEERTIDITPEEDTDEPSTTEPEV